jgi:hypothetical protein
MSRLAAGCGAGIKHPHTIVNIQTRCGQLRAGILYRHHTVGESRQPVNRHRLFDPDGNATQ